jgi:hypothetical protein
VSLYHRTEPNIVKISIVDPNEGGEILLLGQDRVRAGQLSRVRSRCSILEAFAENENRVQGIYFAQETVLPAKSGEHNS